MLASNSEELKEIKPSAGGDKVPESSIRTPVEHMG